MRNRALAVCFFVSLLTLLASSPASAQDWTFCGWEGAACSFSGTQEVRYGADGSYFYRTLSNGTACTNGVFGDPLVGALKSCAVRSAEWTFCAREYGQCAFSGTKEVRYGANGSYFYRTLSNGTACTNDVFGDPALGTWKECAYKDTTTSVSTDWTYCAVEGNACTFSGTREVRYGANGSYFYRTLSNGTACSNSVFGDPAVGALKQCHSRATTAAPPPPTAAPPPTSTYGPRSTITCPATAVDIWPGVNIQTVVNSYGGNTTFCLRAGTHTLRSSVTPKTGNIFVGEYGAVLDGTGWATSDGTQAAFRAHNQDIDSVTIRNLVIRNMPQRGIHAYYWMSNNWTIEYNEIASSGNVGIVIPPSTLIRNNYIHHSAFAGYMGPYAHNSTFDSNEIAYNGDGQKLGETANVTFRNNFVHHNAGGGIWFDSNNTGALIEGNRVEDNQWIGIFYEISSDAIIRNNTIRRNGEAGIMLSVSKNVQIYNNTLEHNFRGITYFLNCASVGGPTSFDLTNNTAHDNTIVVGTQSGAFASLFSHGNCTATQAAPYLNGSKNLTFSRNTYRVPSLSGRYWVWGPSVRPWIEWQALGQDLDGTVGQ
jgi:parallel beta-helix repeat protein